MTLALAWADLALLALVELTGLAAITTWGAHTVPAGPRRWAMAISISVTAMVVWALFCSPRAAVILPLPAVTAIKLAMLTAAIAGLTVTGHPRWAILLGTLALATTTIASALPVNP